MGFLVHFHRKSSKTTGTGTFCARTKESAITPKLGLCVQYLRTGRLCSLSNYTCTDCTIWTLTGRHPVLYVHHQSAQMRHPGFNYQEMSTHASYGGITIIALNPDSCICLNYSRDYYRNRTKPYWYRKYEDVVSESGQLEVGAELEVDHGEIVDSAAMDTNADVDNTHTICNEGTDTIKSVIDQALSKFSEDVCMYTKDVVSMINDPTANTLILNSFIKK